MVSWFRTTRAAKPRSDSLRQTSGSEVWRREWDSVPVATCGARRAKPRSDSLRQTSGSEVWRREWIRTLTAPLESVSYRFHNATVAVDCQRCRGALPAIARHVEALAPDSKP